MNARKSSHEDPQAVVQQMSRSLQTVEKDDLAGMAKLHHWCETILHCKSLPSEESALKVQADAQEAAHLLETVILGETQDPDLSLASAIQKIEDLVRLVQGACPTDALTDVADLSAPTTTGPVTVESGDSVSDAPPPLPEPRAEQNAAPADAFNAEVTEAFDALRDVPVAADDPSKGARPETLSEAAASGAQSDISAAPSDAASLPEPATAPSNQTSLTPATAPQPAAEAEPAFQQVPLVIDTKELEFLKGFVEEAREHIEAIEAALLEVERAPDDPDCIGNLFRPFHTIKGMAGFLLTFAFSM